MFRLLDICWWLLASTPVPGGVYFLEKSPPLLFRKSFLPQKLGIFF